MGFLISQTGLYLLIVAAGFVLGYLVKQFFAGKASHELETMWSEKVRRSSRELDILRADLKTQTQRTEEVERAEGAAGERLASAQRELAAIPAGQDSDSRMDLLQKESAAKDASIEALHLRIAEIEPLAEKGREAKEKDAEIERLRGELLAAAAASAAKPMLEDLKKIRGIGPVMEARLNEYGVHSFKQIAKWSKEDIDQFENLLPRFQRRVERDNWVASAREEHFKQYGEAL